MHVAELCPEALACLPATDFNERILLLRPPGGTHRQAVAVFVHGLFGVRAGTKSTWSEFLPHFGVRFPRFDIAIYQYRTAYHRWRVWRSTNVSDEGRVLAEELKLLAARYDSVVLVGHSLGGLLCQSALNTLADAKATEALRRIPALFAFAVPFLGSVRVSVLSMLLSSDARALRVHGKDIERICTSFQRNFRNKMHSDLRKKDRIATFALLGQEDFWVDPMSAAGFVPIGQRGEFGKTHTSIIRPTDATDTAFTWFAQRLQDVVTAVTTPKMDYISKDFIVAKAEPSAIADVRRLAQELLGQTVGSDFVLNWMRRNSTVLYTVTRRRPSRDVVGYWCILPVSVSTYSALRSGDLTAADLTPELILEPQNESGCYYAGAIAARGNRARSTAIDGMFDFLKQKARSRAMTTGERTRILARAHTKEGLDLVMRSGFSHVGGPDGLGGLYEGEM
jgi:pimeloyl-ACP methyl ester carboxylesterase